MKTTGLLLSAVLLAASAGVVPTSASAALDKSDNIDLVEHLPYAHAGDMGSGGAEIAGHGNYLYAAQMGPAGGIHVLDVSGRKARRVSFIPCPGNHTDVEVVEPGVIAVAAEAGLCAGLTLYDVGRPRRPRVLSWVALHPHTITVYPGRPVVYGSGGGVGRDTGKEYIVDASDPRKPRTSSYQPNSLGCHDVAFHITEEEQLAVCVGGGEGQVWDVSDPLAPTTIGHIPVAGQLPHSIAISPDGSYLVIGEESPGSECGGPGGMLFVYDFSTRQAPVLLSAYESPYDYPPGPAVHYCSPHSSFIPGTDRLVSAWGLGGVDVLDLTDPARPREIAHYVGTDDETTYYWTAEYHRGRIWASDRVRGLDVLRLGE
jgi:hypothetical protein